MVHLRMVFMVILLIGCLAFPYLLECMRFKMDQNARLDAPGDFCCLTKGSTHYRYFGPTVGPLVVRIHGLTTPSFVFEAMANEFVARGYRVLVYDHYGRGFSDRPSGVQDDQFLSNICVNYSLHCKKRVNLTCSVILWVGRLLAPLQRSILSILRN